MDTFNWIVLEMLAEQAAQERLAALEAPAASNETPERRNPVTRAVASSLVRLGLRLDPAAGEGQRTLDLSPVRQEARR